MNSWGYSHFKIEEKGLGRLSDLFQITQMVKRWSQASRQRLYLQAVCFNCRARILIMVLMYILQTNYLWNARREVHRLFYWSKGFYIFVTFFAVCECSKYSVHKLICLSMHLSVCPSGYPHLPSFIHLPIHLWLSMHSSSQIFDVLIISVSHKWIIRARKQGCCIVDTVKWMLWILGRSHTYSDN